ncbi:MAG: LysM peptidoglycan-binding domain-containing protein [Chloroflexota bacterium]
MRRSLTSEVLIAVGGLGIIICGLVFALFLSNDSDAGSMTPSATTVVQVVSTTNPTTSDEPILTNEPTATQTDIATETDAPTATNTPEPTATHTDIATKTDEPTATAEPSETNTSEPTATHTDIATETDAPAPTDTASPTATNAPKNTNTPRPTLTQTPTPSPTNTPSPTEKVSPTEPTETELATGFTGIIPTLPPSPTVAPFDEPTRTPASCDLPRGWTSYTVQSGDTLFAISLVTNSTVDELRFANCIDDIDNITAGDVVYVPIEPVRPVQTTVPSGIRVGLSAVGCTSPATQITSPITAQRVSGTFTVFGTATRPDFQYYKIEVRPDFADIYNFYSDSQEQVVNGILGQINADLFGAGLHWVRLSVVDIRAGIASDAICEIPVIFE